MSHTTFLTGLGFPLLFLIDFSKYKNWSTFECSTSILCEVKSSDVQQKSRRSIRDKRCHIVPFWGTTKVLFSIIVSLTFPCLWSKQNLICRYSDFPTEKFEHIDRMIKKFTTKNLNTSFQFIKCLQTWFKRHDQTVTNGQDVFRSCYHVKHCNGNIFLNSLYRWH